MTPRGAVPRVRRIGLGQSNLTYLVEIAGERLILRRPPPGELAPSAHDVLREHRVISALHGGPVPVPRPILACADVAILGAPFYLMEAVAADAIRFELPPAYSTASCRLVSEQAVDTLAALHAIEPASVGLDELGRPSGYVARQLRRWRAQLEGARTRDTADLDAVADWLAANIPADDQPARIVHGDYKLDNLLFGRERGAPLRAVVDWELATLGDPLADLGWLLAFWRDAGEPPPILGILPRVTEAPGFTTRAELAGRYSARAGRAVPDMRFYVAFARWKLAVIVEAHWARHVRGEAVDFDFAYLESAGPAFAASIRASL